MAKNIEARLGSKEELLKLVEDTIDNGDSLIVAAKTDDKHMALSCMGNPAFAAKVVEQIAMQIINPVLEGKMGNKVNQLEMMAQIIKSGKKLDELIAEVEAEAAHESEEKCAENEGKHFIRAVAGKHHVRRDVHAGHSGNRLAQIAGIRIRVQAQGFRPESPQFVFHSRRRRVRTFVGVQFDVNPVGGLFPRNIRA